MKCFINGKEVEPIRGRINSHVIKNEPVRHLVIHNEDVWDKNRLVVNTKVHGDTHDITKLEIVGYMRGECISTSPRLMFKHFDWVQFVNESSHPITGRVRLLFLGWRLPDQREPTVLICKRK